MREFPCLHQAIHGRPLVYLDSATSAQKPQVVIDSLTRTLSRDYANIHRGVHELSQRATDIARGGRERVRQFLGAADRREIVFTRNGTEAINLVAQSFVRPRAAAGRRGADHDDGAPREHRAVATAARSDRPQAGGGADQRRGRAPARRARSSAFPSAPGWSRCTWVSNALGTVNPVHDIIAAAHARGVPVLLDACQAVQHFAVDVQDLDCEFLVFSGHKLYGPSGIGVLYGKADLLEAMPPYQGGGDMILSVAFEHTDFNELPYKFEAGTPAIEAAVGLGAAIDFVEGLGIERIAAHEAELLAHGTRALQQIPGLKHRRHCASTNAACCRSSWTALHPHDIGTLLDLDGIAVRTGHHCAHAADRSAGPQRHARASLGLYNTVAELDALAASLRRIAEQF